MIYIQEESKVLYQSKAYIRPRSGKGKKENTDPYSSASNRPILT